MRQAMKSAGRTAAHAVWSISDGEVLVPIYQHDAADPSKSCMHRIATEDGAQRGLEWIEKNEHGSVSATFIFDGFAPIEGVRTDSLIIQVRRFQQPAWRIQLCIPYRTVDSPTGFATLTPQLLSCDGFDKEALAGALDAFFEGVESHPQGSAIMNGRRPDETQSAGGQPGAANAIERCAQAPAVIFMLVAAADGSVERKEVEAFKQHMSTSAESGIALLTALAAASLKTFEETLQQITQSGTDPLAFLRETGELMDAQLGEASKPLKSWLVSLALAVAKTNAEGWFSKKLRPAEQKAVHAIAAALKTEV
jgi:hypothetical protein